MSTAHLSQSLKSLVFNQSGFQRIFVSSYKSVKSIRHSNNLRITRHYATGDNCRLYSDKHEWVQVDGSIGTVGISHHAQDALGDVVYAQIPDPGMEVCQNDEVGALESVKAASELYSPVSGKVTEKNTAVEETPSLINTSCYDKGWLFKICLSKPEEIKSLMSEEQYQEFLKTTHQ